GVEQGVLAAARGTENAHKLTGLDADRSFLDRLVRPTALAEHNGHAVDLDQSGLRALSGTAGERLRSGLGRHGDDAIQHGTASGTLPMGSATSARRSRAISTADTASAASPNRQMIGP